MTRKPKKTLFPNYRRADIGACCLTCKHGLAGYDWGEMYCDIHYSPGKWMLQTDVEMEGICDDYKREDV